MLHTLRWTGAGASLIGVVSAGAKNEQSGQTMLSTWQPNLMGIKTPLPEVSEHTLIMTSREKNLITVRAASLLLYVL